ncbi:MAG: Spy/CpxP family protein refolding chaperone [Bacteroides sp.]|nr:Spy/CpxP family protein refolding chaperone [Roseburia sp.]MCM1347001.1 Spy/CpxP family protein refolding chaperone [Bacteroides sp.]MCM1421569.1 Spy/CpxP family protein refolding chaperone [Bacteroides sp.]
MRKIALLAVVAFLGVGSMFAQRGNGRPRMTVEQQVERMKTELSLTDEQTKQVTDLYTDFQKKMQGTERGDREQMRAEREKLEKQVEALLTDEQKTAYKKLQAERRQGPRRENKEK